MVTNYTPDKCRYTIGKLVKSVWLISENAIKDIRIDNGEAWVNSISETPIRIDCTSVGLQEEESLDERYRFVHTLTFSVNGYANSDDFQGKYYAIVKDNNDTYWLVNPLFPCKVTYVYTLSNDENHTDFTLSTASNHPVLRLNGMVDARAYECKEYFIDGISELWLNEKRYSVHDGKNVKYTNDGFKVIDYNKNSATFTETFDGTNTSHSISFDVLFSSYKSSWHYNLLEFIDECIKNNNLYSAIIKTRNGKYAMCGFSFGLQPSFNITADDTTQEINKVQISLQDVHTVGDPIDFYNSADYEHLTAKTWVYTAEHNGYECVGDGLAKYLLQKEVDALGNDTCNYKALAGYENNFPELNIVGTFDDVVTFASSECTIMPCRLATSLQRNIVFNDVGSKTYTVRAGSDWTITSNEDITVSPSSGSANQSYTITVYNTHTPTTEPWITNLNVSYCDDMEYNSVITVVEDDDSCFTDGSTYNITANEQILDVKTECCIKSVKDKSGAGVSAVIYERYISLHVPENTTGVERVIVLLIELCDGSIVNLTIIQSNVAVLYEWERTDETICVYTGIDEYRWVESGTTCVGNDLYVNNVKQVSRDSGQTWINTSETSASTLIEANSEQCGYVPPIIGNYLTFETIEAGKFRFSGTTETPIYYSIDSGSTWSSLSTGQETPELQSGKLILWKGELSPVMYRGIGTFSSTGTFNGRGNVMSLLYGDNYEGKTDLSSKVNAFQFLFYFCSTMLDAGDMVLPATTLSDRCYSDMFLGCQRMKRAPQLPATTMVSNCYYQMFKNCRELETAPTLSASTLAERCYQGMFESCSKLNNVTCLASSITANYCTLNWMVAVPSSGTFTKARGMNSWVSGDSGIPNGWIVKNS